MITSEADLRAVMPTPLSKVRLKILPKLERHSLRFIELASVLAISVASPTAVAPISLVLGRGRLKALDESTVAVDDPDAALAQTWRTSAASGRPLFVGALLLIPGIGETLRINGHLAPDQHGDRMVIAVDEVYLQCPKALVRSELWNPATWQRAAPEQPAAADEAAMHAFIAAAPFALLATADASGHADLSPRGDPAGGFIRRVDAQTLLLPDRTGNHLVDSLRNIIANPRATLAVLVPGASYMLQISAQASLTADTALLAASTLRGKAPKVGILLQIIEMRFAPLQPAMLWNPNNLMDPATFPTMGQMILDQVNPGGKTINKIGSALFDLGNSFHKKHRLY